MKYLHNMSAAPILDDDPVERLPAMTLSPYRVVLRCTRRLADSGMSATELIDSLAIRLGVLLTFDDVGYDAEFTIVADDETDAVRTARRRWFYLATDLGLPPWPVTDVAVTAL